MTDKEVVGAILQAETSLPAATKKECEEMGLHVGKTYTDHGLPIDMAFSELEKQYPGLNRNAKIVILGAALNWLVQHKRNSGATDKAIDRQRRANREAIRSFLAKGETGVY